MPRPQQWTEAEVHRLRMLAKRKVSADSIAKSLGRYVGSVKTKALELTSDPLQEGEGEGEIALGPICLAFAVQQAQPLLRGPLERTSVVNGNILNSKGVHVGVVVGDEVFGLKGQKLYDLKGSNIYKLNGDLVGHLSDARGAEKRLDKATDKLFPST